MTLVESAIVLAWIAIALLSAGFAVLVRQTAILSRFVSAQTRGTEPHRSNPILGLRLPPDSALQPWLDAGSDLLALYVSPACGSCRGYLQDCQKTEQLRRSDQPVVVVSSGRCYTDVSEWPANWTCLEYAVTEHERINAPAVPYIAIIRSDRLVAFAGLAVPPNELVAMLGRNGSKD